MPDRLGPFIADPVAYAKREGMRRRMRELGIHAVPKREVLDRIVAEHDAAEALVKHDAACEAPAWMVAEDSDRAPCFCTERAHVLDVVNANARREADEWCKVNRWRCNCGSVDKYGDDLGEHSATCPYHRDAVARFGLTDH